jgi:excisionase family DNA binding protein
MMLITIQQAAELTNRSARAIYNWIDAGKLKAVLDIDGLRKVDGAELFKVEATIRRGRPKATR